MSGERICCPKCLSVNFADGAAAPKSCFHCQFDFGWFRQCPKAKEALSEAACGPVDLVVSEQWSGGETERRRSGDDPFSVAVVDARVRIEFTKDRRAVNVTIGDNAPVSYPLPAKLDEIGKEKWRCRVRSVVVLDADHTLRAEISENVTSDKLEALAERFEGIIGRRPNNWIKAVGLDDVHCILARQSRESVELSEPGASTDAFWLIDDLSTDGTFVNGDRIVARRLQSGDLVQAGPYAWQFSHSAGSNAAFMIPQKAIRGDRVQLHGAEIKGRLGPLDVEFLPREVAAIRGESGSGKSTLVKAIIGEIRLSKGRISLGSIDDIARRPEALRRRLGYVSQKLVIHEQLTARQVVEFAARFRRHRRSVDEDQVETALREVGLPGGPEDQTGSKDKKNRWNAKVKHLSGGEQQRVKLAAEIVSDPELFVLDEPTSGLDGAREDEMLRMLRVLSRRGAAVLVVIHSNRGDFDRTIELEKSEGAGKLKRIVDRRGQAIPSPSSLASQAVSMPLAWKEGGIELLEKVRRLFDFEGIFARAGGRIKTDLGQFFIHLQRERALLLQSWLRRLALPLCFVPALFALALALSVPSGEHGLLGLLSVLSCIWMGASLSLLSIADERRVIDHERLVFLNVAPYMAAKTLFLLASSFAQTSLFLAALKGFHWLSGRPDDFLRGGCRMYVALIVVGWASVGVGLLLSAISGTDGGIANFALPLVMIAQIVFSVAVAVDGDSYSAPYRDRFSWSRSDSPIAAKASYCTLSRWGDMAVRSFQDSSDESQRDYWWGIAVLGGVAIVLPVLAGLIVRVPPVQEWRT